ncbi:Dak1 domain-containing protein [Vararia minispora EC-137]|uniref:Dak1 domain-containing protein n=1 Tax=Vararia minispora EC-137 TaxID=1314806 RepID=A0ACB8QRQ1_9AGAM|nr:Dak1 domain-containing protein [Vararia minispora EC-137]
MSTKHIFPSPDGLVLCALRGAVAMNPTLRLHEPSKSVYIAEPSPEARVALIAGGGAGHEPAHASYTGKGMLAVAVSGEIFASPSAGQLLTAIELALLSSSRPDTGVLVVCNNYTGDRLNFGLALTRARAQFPGLKIEVVINADDVSLLHTKSLVGPRGLGGNILVCKILGAAAVKGTPIEEVKKLGDAVVGQLASVGVGLAHCHVPGRPVDTARGDSEFGNTCEIGMGLHNEPGAREGTFQSASDLVDEMLSMVLQSRKEGFVQIGKDAAETDEVVLFVNNLGGISQLEQCAVVDEALSQLQTIGIHPRRVYASAYMTSLNAPGFSLSLLNVSAVQRSLPGVDLYALLDAPADALAWAGVRTGWPSVHRNYLKECEETVQKLESFRMSHGRAAQTMDCGVGRTTSSYWREADISTQQVEAGIRAACHAVLSVAPELTVFDTVVGDGDCGETFAAGGQAIIQALDTGAMDVKSLSPAELVQMIGDICEQNMGGTIGALFAIFFTSLSSSVPTSGQYAVKKSWQTAPLSALNALSAHTPALPGDRTLVDALRPFCDSLARSGDLQKAAEEARRGAAGTSGMHARLGRATYVGTAEHGGQELPPDPGAWGVAALIEGLYKGMNGTV